MIKKNAYDPEIIMELIRKLNSLSNYITENNCCFAFNPVIQPDRGIYEKNICLLKGIYEMLNCCDINIKSRGYSYLTDALCIVYDHKSLDLCLEKEVYRLISDKHRLESADRVEHSIRNSINAAYSRSVKKTDGQNLMTDTFDARPSNKTFIMKMAQLLMEQMSADKQKD